MFLAGLMPNSEQTTSLIAMWCVSLLFDFLPSSFAILNWVVIAFLFSGFYDLQCEHRNHCLYDYLWSQRLSEVSCYKVKEFLLHWVLEN